MPGSSSETISDKRYRKLRRKRWKKRVQQSHNETKKHDLLRAQKKNSLFPKSYKSIQSGRDGKPSDHKPPMSRQFGSKVTTKCRLTRPAQITGMFAQGAQSTYVARGEAMNEVTKAYLKEDLHHIIELANARNAPMKTSRRLPAGPQPVRSPQDRSSKEDDPSPCRWSPARCTTRSPMPTVPHRGVHGSPGPSGSPGPPVVPGWRFSPGGASTPLGRSPGRGGGASPAPGDLESFLAACAEGMAALEGDLLALGSHAVDWPADSLRRLRDLYRASHSSGGDPARTLTKDCGALETPKVFQKAGKASAAPSETPLDAPAKQHVADGSQRSSSQQSTGVQTSPGLLQQDSQQRGDESPARTLSDWISPEVCGPKMVLDPRWVLEMMSANKTQRLRPPSPGPVPGGSSSSSGGSCRPHRCRPRAEVVRQCCAEGTDSCDSCCGSIEEKADRRTQNSFSTSDEESPEFKYYCFRLH